jgi:hypothetical protein
MARAKSKAPPTAESREVPPAASVARAQEEPDDEEAGKERPTKGRKPRPTAESLGEDSDGKPAAEEPTAGDGDPDIEEGQESEDPYLSDVSEKSLRIPTAEEDLQNIIMQIPLSKRYVISNHMRLRREKRSATSSDALQAILTRMELSQEQIEAIIEEGYTTVASLRAATPEDIEAAAKNIMKRKPKVIIGVPLTKRLKALAFWVRSEMDQDQPFDPDKWDDDEEGKMTVQMEIDAKRPKEVPLPEIKWDALRWPSIKRKLVTYFSQVTGAMNIPLVYVIREDKEQEEIEEMDFDERRIYLAKHRGPNYTADNQLVFRKLTDIFGSTDVWTWIRGFQEKLEGRKAWKELVKHYDGPGEVEKRKAQAEYILKNTFYKGKEESFSFENYTTKLSEGFELLAEAKLPKYESDKVKILLENIKFDNQTILSAITHIQMTPDYKSNFTKAVNKLSEVVSTTYGVSAHTVGTPRRTASANTWGKPPPGGRGRGRGRSYGRGRNPQGRGGGYQGWNKYSGNSTGGPKFKNGVDITDPNRKFTKAEVQALGTYMDEIKRLRKKSREVKRMQSDKDGSTQNKKQKEGDDAEPTGSGSGFGQGAYEGN